MEVTNKRSNTGEIVGIEGDRTRFTLCWGGRVIVGAEQEPPYFGAGGLAVSSEEDGIVFGEQFHGRLIEEYAEVVLTQIIMTIRL